MADPVQEQNEAFLAEMRRRREAAGENPVQGMDQPSAPSPVQNSSYNPLPPVADSTSEKGIIGFLIKQGIVKNKSQAEMLLLGVLVVVLILIAWINFF